MNQIEKGTITEYNQEISMPYIDGEPLNIHLSKQTSDKSLAQLWSAWEGLNNVNEQAYIKQLLCYQIDGIVPILICPDDMDLSCITIVADVKSTNNTVYWKRVGVLKAKNWSNQKWVSSGIRNTTRWSNEQFQSLDYLRLLDKENPEWDQWICANWPYEESMRLWNYHFVYMNNQENIEWYDVPSFEFNRLSYRQCVEQILVSNI
ncbi:hypothetical protein G7062_02010 [Erysipelothrix sp. HDW6C]|uniref:hypothetical protein n=1 Tax=Erysipelothrix sp. HDW6C TaxID=2714930 RepID=UPI00140E325C|nr:hypothetical protein [Erysipelothrix sp. HDW6C]QIK69130.1 hypothetical protein G7062_02010 [Erysipelothrix sp. HDW6C]